MQNDPSPRKVLISGLGFVTSIGNDRNQVTDSLLQLKNGIEVFPEFTENPQCPISVLGTLQGFDTTSGDPEDWSWPQVEGFSIKRDALRWMNPHVLYAVLAMHQAIADSGLPADLLSHPQTGLYTASAGSSATLYRHLDRMYKVGPSRCSPTGVVASVTGTLSFNLVALHKILGESCGFASACASSSHALGFAADAIRSGRQQRIFVIGAEDGNAESILPFAAMRALSPSADPATASRPFDKHRDGFVGTGGATVLLLESEQSLQDRGGKAYAEFAGWGQSSDGYNVAITHPQGEGLIRAMQAALSSADLVPEQIDYINAHATSTPIGDLSEAKAIGSVFADSQPLVSSTKALTGHGLSLAGAMEAAFTALSLHQGFIPGNAHLTDLDPDCGHLSIPRQTLSQQANYAISNSSGFGGANVSLILKRV